MQEPSNPRPSDFVKIRDGFIAFLKQPAGTSLEAVIPPQMLDAMGHAARLGRRRRRRLDVLRIASLVMAMTGVVLSVATNPMIMGVSLLLVGGAGFVWAQNRGKIRDELEIDEAMAGPDLALQRSLHALDAYRGLIASGDIPCEERLPDGTLKPLSPNVRRAFLADHGALLVLSRDQGLWQCIPHRPIPMSPLWVKLGGRVAPVFVTSRALLETADRQLFDRRIAWLLAHADQSSARARSFREAVQIIVALRRPELDGLTFERKKELLSAEGLGESRMEKIHAGVYPAFNNFLRSLPMHEFP